MAESPRFALTELLKEAVALSHKNAILIEVVDERLTILDKIVLEAEDSLVRRTAVQERRLQELETWQRRQEDRQGAMGAAQVQARGQLEVAQMQAGTQVTMGKLVAVVTIMSGLMGLLGILLGLWLRK